MIPKNWWCQHANKRRMMLNTFLGAGAGKGLRANRGACRFSGYFASKFHCLGDVCWCFWMLFSFHANAGCREVQTSWRGCEGRELSDFSVIRNYTKVHQMWRAPMVKKEMPEHFVRASMSVAMKQIVRIDLYIRRYDIFNLQPPQKRHVIYYMIYCLLLCVWFRAWIYVSSILFSSFTM